MKNRQPIVLYALLVLICVGASYWVITWSKTSRQKTVNEATAIGIIQNKFPELKNFLSNQIPPRTIKTEKTSDGWYVAFIQEGSGRPIISAKCFFVDNNKNVVEIDTFNPPINDPARTVSPKTCRAATPNENSFNLPNG